jgi:alkyl hydroperoxide reductase subunit AhpC
VVCANKRELRSLDKKDAPEDFKSLKRGEISSFDNCVEKFDKGDGLVISIVLDEEFIHFEFKKDFLFHFEFRVDFKGL